METNEGSVLWAIFLFLGPVILGLAMFYGFYRHKTRNRRLDPMRDRATRAVQRREDKRDSEKKSPS